MNTRNLIFSVALTTTICISVPARAEPISMSIGLTALIAGLTGEAVAVGTIASAIGGGLAGQL